MESSMTTVAFEGDFALIFGCGMHMQVKDKFFNDLALLSRKSTPLKPEYVTAAKAFLDKYGLDLKANNISHENCI